MREGISGGHLGALVKCKGRNKGDRGVSEEEARFRLLYQFFMARLGREVAPGP